MNISHMAKLREAGKFVRIRIHLSIFSLTKLEWWIFRANIYCNSTFEPSLNEWKCSLHVAAHQRFAAICIASTLTYICMYGKCQTISNSNLLVMHILCAGRCVATETCKIVLKVQKAIFSKQNCHATDALGLLPKLEVLAFSFAGRG